jgi:hypothetical protein
MLPTHSKCPFMAVVLLCCRIFKNDAGRLPTDAELEKIIDRSSMMAQTTPPPGGCIRSTVEMRCDRSKNLASIMDQIEYHPIKCRASSARCLLLGLHVIMQAPASMQLLALLLASAVR